MEASERDFELTLLERQLARQRVLLVVAMLAVAGALVWSFGLGRAAARRGHQLEQISAVVDSLDSLAVAQRLRIQPIEEQVESLGPLRNTVRTDLERKADLSDLLAVDAKLERIARRLARSDSLLARMEAGLASRAARWSAAQAGSLTTLRDELQRQLADAREMAGDQGLRLASLDGRVAELEGARNRARTWNRVRDLATVTAFGLIAAQ